MIIKNIQISNFGILKEISLNLDGMNNNVLFINGENGRGKTTFQSAIKWCIYGTEPTNQNKFFSNSTLAEMAVQEKNCVSVSITISIEDGKSAVIERKQYFEKNKNGYALKVGKTDLLVKIIEPLPSREVSTHPNPEAWLNEKFPIRFANFFLFDGELMRDFFSLSVKGAIEDAVKQIAGVDIFDEISQKFKAIEVSNNRKISKLSGSKAEKINEDLEIAKSDLEQHRILLQEINFEIALCNERSIDTDNKLKNYEGYEFKSSAISSLTDEIAEISDNIKDHESQFYKMIYKNGTFGFFASALGKLDVVVNKATEEDRLPPPFMPDRIKKLIQDKMCICGSDLTHDVVKIENLNILIDRYKMSSDIGLIINETNNTIFNQKKIVINNIKHIENYKENIAKLKSKLSTKTKSRETLLDELGNVDIMHIKELAKLKKELISKKDDLVRHEALLSQKINELTQKVRELDKKFKEASKGNEDAKVLTKEAEFAVELAAAASSIHKMAIEQTRIKLEESVSTKFSKVIDKEIARTEINENFEVLTKWQVNGKEMILSEGEAMMKAYIFSIALREIINLDFPLIVDTPLGRLSEKPRATLASMLSELILSEYVDNDRQIIFLMTDSEYTPYTKKNFAEAKPSELYLSVSEGSNHQISNIAIGIDPEWYKLTAWKDWHEGRIK
jgi:DNA sulfur modification protein DndD